MSKLSNGVLILLTLVTVWCGASIAIGEYRLALFAIGLTSFVAAGAWLYNRVPPLIPNEERKKLWRDFGDALSSYESVLKNLRYASALKPAPDSSQNVPVEDDEWASAQLLESAEASNRIAASIGRSIGRRMGAEVLGQRVIMPEGPIALSQIQSILKGDAVAPPHGVELLKPFPIPKFPDPPARPKPPSILGYRDNIERADRLEQKRKQLQAEFEAQFQKDSDQLASLQQGCAPNDPQAIRLLMSLSHLRHPLPSPLM